MEISDRIDLVIAEKKLKKVEFAQILKIDQSYVTQLIKGKNNPSERLIDSICEKFDINKDWLLYGKGEMDLKLTKSQQIMKYTAMLLKDTDSAVANAIINFIITYEQLDEASKKVLNNVAQSFLDSLNNASDK